MYGGINGGNQIVSGPNAVYANAIDEYGRGSVDLQLLGRDDIFGEGLLGG